MNEANIRREIYQMLRYRYGLWPDHWPDIAGKKRPGRPDLIIMNPRGPGFYIEVKHINLTRVRSFSFKSIGQSQRRWLSLWEEQRPNGSYLAIGVTGEMARDVFIVPWLLWLKIEETVKSAQSSLPYLADSTHRLVMRRNAYDFRMIDKWSCRRIAKKNRLPKESGWVLPPELICRMELMP